MTFELQRTFRTLDWWTDGQQVAVWTKA